MTIPLFSGDARRTDSYANTTVKIPGYFITVELYSHGLTLDYQTVSNADQLSDVIKQSMEVLTITVCNRQRRHIKILNQFCTAAASLANAQIVMLSEKILWSNLVLVVSHKIHHQVALMTANLPPDDLDEVFHVHS
jgi:hypothetical protein